MTHPTGASTSMRTLRWTSRVVSRVAAVSIISALTVALTPAVVWALDDPALEQTVEADEGTVEGGVVIATGHVDLGPRFLDGTWRLQARDDRQAPPVWRDPRDVVLHLSDAAILAAPDDPDYAFLDVEPGAPLWVIPQTQEHDVVWLGWNTQDPEVVGRIDRGASLTLHDVDGPGRMLLFLQEGVSGPPNLLWDSRSADPQQLWMEVNTHTHANWVFTEPGVYRLTVELHAELTDDTTASDTAVLRLAVGDDTDPQALLAATEPDPTSPSSPSSPPAADPGQAGVEDHAGSAADTPPATTGALRRNLLTVSASAAVLLAAVVALTVSGRRTRARAAVEAAARPDPREPHL